MSTETTRGIDGRLFKNYAPEYLQLLLERVGFQQIGRWDGEDALARAGTRWYTLLFELRSTGALRAVDQIEGILNRDKKVASYKLVSSGLWLSLPFGTALRHWVRRPGRRSSSPPGREVAPVLLADLRFIALHPPNRSPRAPAPPSRSCSARRWRRSWRPIRVVVTMVD